MLFIIGFVCVSLLPTSELRRSASAEFWRDVARMNTTKEFYDKYVKKPGPTDEDLLIEISKHSKKSNGAEEDSLIKIISKHSRKSNVFEGLRSFADTMEGNVHEEFPDSMLEQIFPCYPMNTSVELPRDPDPRIEWFPRCAILPRCGGCCMPGLTCLPTKKKQVQYPVFKGIPNQKFETVYLPMESHVECQCSCGIQEGACNLTTHRISEQCLCECRNANDADSCPLRKMWDEKECQCKCRSSTNNCLSGEVFDTATCSCKEQN